MPCELISPTSEDFPHYNLITNSEVPKEKNDDSINLDAPRRRDKSTGDQEMVTVKKVYFFHFAACCKYIVTEFLYNYFTELQFLFAEGSFLHGLGKEASKVLQKNSDNILHHTK